METINKKDLLDCLKTSTLVKKLFENEDTVTVPKQYVIKTININNDQELKETIKILRYWMVDNAPYELYDYVMSITHKNVDLIGLEDSKVAKEVKLILESECGFLSEFSRKRDLLKATEYHHNNLFNYLTDKPEYLSCIDETVLKYCMMSGNQKIIEYCYSDMKRIKINDRFIAYCYITKYPNVFRYIYENDRYINWKGIRFSHCGKLDMNFIKYIHNCCTQPFDERCTETPCQHNPFCNNLLTEAVRQNNFEIVKYLLDNGCPHNVASSAYSFDNPCLKAIQSKNLEMLKYLHRRGCILNNNLCDSAMSYDQNCLKYLYELGYRCTSNFYQQNNEEGMKMLNYIIENGTSVTEQMIIKAVKQGNLDILKYLHEKSNKTLKQLIKKNKYNILYHMCFSKYIKNPYSADITSIAVQTNLKMLKYVIENGFEPTERTLYYSYGKTDNLKYLFDYMNFNKDNLPSNIDNILKMYINLDNAKYLDYLIKYFDYNNLRII